MSGPLEDAAPPDTGGRPQVIVVGFGPTGVALAGLLGQRGVRVAVFDKMPGLHPLPRAAGMDQEVMRIAQELGIADELESVVVPYRASEYRGVRGEVIKRLDSPPPPHRLGWEPMFAFDQPAFEGALRRRVAELPNVTVSVETEVLEVGQDDDGVWVDVRRPGSAGTERVRGDWLVACDGGASPIRTQLGGTMTDLGFHESWLVVDAIIESNEALARLPVTQVQYCEPERPSTFVNLVGRHRRWEIALEPDELPVGAVDDDTVWPYLARWIDPLGARIWRAAAYMFHGLVADRWREGRVLLAGDAAHMTPPFMAQGMAQGMRDAQNLAWKLHAVVSGRAEAGLLDSYEHERRPHALTTTMRTIELGRVISERDESLALARDKELLDAHDGEVPVTVRSNLIPPLTDGLLAVGTPGAGEILPQPFVETADGVVRRLDEVTGAGFRVVVGAEVSAGEVERLRGAAGPLDAYVVVLVSASAGADGAGVSTSSTTDAAGVSTSSTSGGAGVSTSSTTGYGSTTGLVDRDDVLTGWLAGLGSTVAIARPDHAVYGTAVSVDDACRLLEQLVQALGASSSPAAPAEM